MGFGSLGYVMSPPYRHVAVSQRLAFILAIAVASEFQGMPATVSPEKRYASQMMGDILAMAAETGEEIVLLEVDSENISAKRFYDSFGFTHLLRRDKRKDFGDSVRTVQYMHIRL